MTQEEEIQKHLDETRRQFAHDVEPKKPTVPPEVPVAEPIQSEPVRSQEVDKLPDPADTTQKPTINRPDKKK